MAPASAFIRQAGPEDRAAIEAIVEAAYAPYIPRIGRKPGPMLDDYEILIADGRVHVLVDGGIVRGLVVLIPDGDALLLDNVAVDPRAQGRGYGRMLLNFAEAEARRTGVRTLRLYTNEAMTENIALYGRLGFVETHRAVEKGLRRIYMTKVLKA
ncbi:GNAT family N-acetyltransferase [Microvirga sp. 17 mud 1-3]|uniref:GNAT family N-acetyltransferase n=1 Tax=Microvirga sp. 17 mud 1-3 TaxID=2082949 RepID=UPI000D6B6B7F|nr:GNAT family N-acetyltransferase [Microvirga sp. 17 mud 1-3]AWM89285.1 GNAT family N-acetyltransferase [Microvirga sp. 17 mud 1-3]